MTVKECMVRSCVELKYYLLRGEEMKAALNLRGEEMKAACKPSDCSLQLGLGS